MKKKERTHGSSGFIDSSDSEHSGLARVRPPRPENLSQADSVAAKAILNLPPKERPLEARPTHEWAKRRTLIKGKKNKLSIMGFNPELMDEGNPKFVEMLKLSNDYRKTRTKELLIAHGFVSSGVSSFLASAALALAASRYVYEDAIRTGNKDMLTTAAKLGTDARQNELSAWELCAREAVARRKAASEIVGVPWLDHQDGGKKKVGRPRKDDKLKEELKLEYVDAWTQPTESKESNSSTEEWTASGEASNVSGDR